MTDFMSGVVGGATVGIVIKAYDEYSKELNKAKDEVGQLAVKSKYAWNLIGAAAVGATVKLTEYAIKAAKAADVQEQFNHIVGSNSVAVLKSMQKETLGTIDKFTLMSAASAAAARGVDVSFLPIITRFSMQMKDAGIATGEVTDIINELTTSLATGRTASLARYGIELSGVGEGLSGAAKDAAIFTEAIKQITSKSGEMAASTLDAADKVDILKVKWKEFTIDIGTKIEPAVSGISSVLINSMEGFTRLTDFFSTSLAFGDVGTAWNTMWEKAYDRANKIPPVINKTGEETKKLIEDNKQLLDLYEKQREAQLTITTTLERQASIQSRQLLSDHEFSSQQAVELSDGTWGAPSSSSRKNDFVMRPGQPAVSFSPQDTLIGVKDTSKLMGGVNIYIESVQGLSADAVAEALQRKIGTALSL